MHETIAVIFDFDDTLAPDSTSGYLNDVGLKDLPSFWKKEVATLTDADWDPVPAYLHKIIEASKTGRIPKVTQDSLMGYGRRHPLHDGVQGIFSRLRTVAKDANPRASIEFYLISSGIGDILRETPIAHEFTDIWASEFSYGSDGGIEFPKKPITKRVGSGQLKDGAFCSLGCYSKWNEAVLIRRHQERLQKSKSDE